MPNEAVLYQVDAADGIAGADFIQQLDDLYRLQLHAVDRDRLAFGMKPISTTSSRSGASCGERVITQVVGKRWVTGILELHRPHG